MTAKEILRDAGYPSTDELLQSWALMMALAKVDQYRAENEFFAAKYGCTLEQFAQRLNDQAGHEDFGMEDDWADWRFAHNAMRWWVVKVEELRSAITS